MTCAVPELDWPDCPVPVKENDFAVDTLGWLIASALQEAAECIAKTGPCPKSHFTLQTDRDGDTVHVPKGPQVVYGEPQVDPDCCGAITTGIVWPLAPTDNPCISFLELEFRVKVSWCGDIGMYEQMIDAHRIDRHLTNLACCKLKPYRTTNTPKFDLKIVAYNSIDENNVCDMLTFTVKATP